MMVYVLNDMVSHEFEQKPTILGYFDQVISLRELRSQAEQELLVRQQRRSAEREAQKRLIEKE
jgi:hypothetical protein